MSEQTTDPKAADRAFIMNPDDWPRWPHLPMKKPSGKPGVWPEHGVIVDKGGFHGPLKFPVTLNIYGEAGFDVAERKVYNNVEEILADGWIVD